MSKDKDPKHQMLRALANAERLIEERPDMGGVDVLSFVCGYLSGSFPDMSEAFERVRDAARQNEVRRRFPT